MANCWKPDEDARLIALRSGDHPMSYFKISRALGRSESSVRHRACVLDIPLHRGSSSQPTQPKSEPVKFNRASREGHAALVARHLNRVFPSLSRAA